MKTNLLITGIAICTLGISGCGNDVMDNSNIQKSKLVNMNMQVSGPLPRDGNIQNVLQEIAFAWNSGDAISVVINDAIGNENCRLVTPTSGTSASFSGTVTEWGTDKKAVFAFYPYAPTAYLVKEGNNPAKATVKLTLAHQQTSSIGNAIRNSFMVGVSAATKQDSNISTSVEMKQVMSFIRLNITNAPDRIKKVTLKAEKNVFPTTATIELSSAEISDQGKHTSELAMIVTDKTAETAETTKTLFFPIIPVDLTGNKIAITVDFADGTSNRTETDGVNCVRNMQHEITLDNMLVTGDYLEVNGIKVAIGNLVANGANGAKIGVPTDYGLYFQFGSLIGWSGGTSGDGSGSVDNTSLFLSQQVAPAGYTGSATWKQNWKGRTETDNAAEGTGDPCRFYLGATWRLPTKEEFETLFNNSTGSWEETYGWSRKGPFAVHKSGAVLPTAGRRDNRKARLQDTTFGYYWSSSSQPEGRYANALFFEKYYVEVSKSYSHDRANGFPVRCVRD